MNNVTYIAQKVPTLYTAMTTGQAAQNPIVYGMDTNPFVLKYGDIVQLVVDNQDSGL
jgi:iron transport multicopper oxidase